MGPQRLATGPEPCPLLLEVIGFQGCPEVGMLFPERLPPAPGKAS